jgi:hypothetical protein
LFTVPAHHEHGTVLHACGHTAVVLDGYAVHESEDVLRLLADAFGLSKYVQPAPAPEPTPVTVTTFVTPDPED